MKTITNIEAVTRQKTTEILVTNTVKVNEIPRYFCDEQSYGVFFKLINLPISIDVDVYADNEFELTESEVEERGLNVLLASQNHLTSRDVVFLNSELYQKKYAPMEKTFKLQKFTVRYRMKQGDVALNVQVEFLDKPAILEDDIIKAANAMLDECVEIEGEYFYEDIITHEITENPEPPFPFLHLIRPDDEREEYSDEAMIEHLTSLGYDLTDDEGNITTYNLSEIAANSEGFTWDDKNEVWF